MDWLKKIGSMVRRRQSERDLADELQHHVELKTEENIEAGMTRDEARCAALKAFGSVEQKKELCRDADRLRWIEDFIHDLRFGFRQIRRAPGFAATAALILGLGIGVNAAIFSMANAVLWHTLPVSNPHTLVRLVAIREDRSERDALPVTIAEELRRTSTVFSGLITRGDDGLSFSVGGGRAERIMGEVVSPNFFTFLGIRPVLGEGFSQGVQKGRWAPEVVLSYRFWQRQFHGDPRVLGRSVRLNGYPFTIVGVSPSNFYSLVRGFDPELRLPRLPPGQELSQIRLLSNPDAEQTMARLKPGVSMTQAEAATDAECQRLLQESPSVQHRASPTRHVRLLPGDRGWEGDLVQFRSPLLILFGLAGLVLLIASTNLASMLLARSAGRQREFALRAAIGAGRGRLVRQLLTESALLSVSGGLLAFAAVSRAGTILFGFLPQGHISISLDLAPDSRVAWFTLVVTLVAGLIFGLIPALQATRCRLAESLKSDSAASIGQTGGISVRKILVSGQVALSLLLAMAAALMWQSLRNLRAGDFFPQPDRVLLFTLKPQVELYSSAHMRRLTAEIVRQMAELPGIESAALAEDGPLGDLSRRQGTVKTTVGHTIEAGMDAVSPGFFETTGVPLLRGRDFSSVDRNGVRPVAIVNQLLARRLFKNENPLGKLLLPPPNSGWMDGVTGPLKIIGVVQSTRYSDLHSPPPPAMYVDIQQGTAYMPTLHVRLAAGANAADVTTEVRREFTNIDRNFPVFEIKTLADRVNDSLARERLVGQLAGAFGILALALVVVGLYGVVAYTVAQRTREIGLRMALGAQKGDVLRLVLGQGMSLAVGGVGIGLVGGLALTRFLSSLLYGVKPTDPLTFALVLLGLLAVAVVACYIPAWRATKVDPMVALRHE
jgi:predicted permease